jgi:hypothetical protein
MGLFGSKFPSTEKIEQQEALYKRLYQEVTATSKSEELAEYISLQDEIHSPEFLAEKAKIISIKWKKTPEFEALKEFEKLSDNKSLKKYFELLGSEELKDYFSFKDSDQYGEITDKTKRKDSELLTKHFRFEQSKRYRNYTEVAKGNLPKRFAALKTEVESPEFKAAKDFAQNKHRWQLTEGYKKEIRFNQLAENKDIQNYLKYHNSNVFDFFKHYEITFDDNFEPEKLDSKKWNTQFLLAAEYGKGNFSKTNQLQAFTNGHNIDISRDYLSIETRKEKATGRVWSPKKGFVQKEMEFTSGVISTGKSFAQNEGIFKVKFKTESKPPVGHSIQLTSPKNEVQISLLHTTKKGNSVVGLTIFDGKTHKVRSKKIKGLKLNNHFYIVSFEWQNQLLVWKINDVEVFTTEIAIPAKELFLEICSVVYKTKQTPAPGKLIIDWVKAYKRTV